MAKQWALKKKTVNLSGQSLEALEFVVRRTGKTETHAINDAVQDFAVSLGWERPAVSA